MTAQAAPASIRVSTSQLAAGRSLAVRRSMTVMPRVKRPAVSTATCRAARSNSAGWVSASTARVVDGGAGHRRAPAVAGGVEVEEVGEDRASDPAGGARPRSGRCGQQLVGEVEAAITSGTRTEHGGGGLRVGPDVVLGDGRAVAERAATHDRDPGEAAGEVRGGAQGQGDVRERADADEPRALVRPARLDDEADGVRAVERAVRGRQVGAVEP